MPGQFNTSPSQDGGDVSTTSNTNNGLYAHNDAISAAPPGVPGGNGVFGLSTVPNASGVFGANNQGGTGVSGFSAQGDGARGDTQASTKNGVVGTNSSNTPAGAGVPGGNGVYGFSKNPNASGVCGIGDGTGVSGFSAQGDGTRGDTQASGKNGVVGTNSSAAAVPAGVPGGNGVYGYSKNQYASGVCGIADGGGTGVSGFSAQGDGARGDTQSNAKNGLVGTNSSNTPAGAGVPGGNGVYGFSKNPNASGVCGIAEGGGTGVFGFSPNGTGIRGAGKIAGHFDGDVEVTGDVKLLGADCAEDFDVVELENVEPGTVMVIDQSGALRQSREPYDKRVAGVVSGAGDYKPGLILNRAPHKRNRKSIALLGRVYCKVDARPSPIQIGDLLTTSPSPGHAMKADDAAKAFGAVLGKALHPLQDGQGLIPILIALQ